MNLSPDTLKMLEGLLAQVQLPASAPNFDELAAQISTAKRELKAALAEFEEPVKDA